MNDKRLIRDYCLQGDQEAFAELVRRYSGLVYGTARRHVGDPFVAEEICQKAFCALAAQIGLIKKPSQLPAWLFQTTRRLAAMQVRSDYRRVARERMAANMDSNDVGLKESWEDIEPLLNEGLDSLREKDRAAILLRFFRGMSMAEVAEVLGSSEPAAKMRVGRAVDKLRTFLVQHGVSCSAAALLVVLGRNASAQAPDSVIASVLDRLARTASTLQSGPLTPRARPGLRVGATVTIGVVLLGLVWIGSARWRSTKQTVGPDANLGQAIAETQPTAPTPAKPGIAAVPSGQLRVVVRDENTSLPLAGVRITASNMGEVLGDAITDWEGYGEVPRPTSQDGDFYYKLRAEYRGYASINVSWSRFQHDDPSDIPQTYEVKMPQGTRIGGLITDEDSLPLPGIQLRIQSYWSLGGPPPRERPLLADGSFESTATDQEGKWSFDRLPLQWQNLRFKAATRAFLPAEYVCDASDRPASGEKILTRADLLANRARIMLRRGPVLIGKVLDDNRTPIAGVRVVQNFNWLEAFATTTTAADGGYEIVNAPTGMLVLSFQAEHFSPQTIRVRIEGPTAITPVVLSPGHPLRGRVLDDSGRPVEGVSLQVSQIGTKSQEFQFRTTTDATGLFSWDGAPATPLTVAFHKMGFRTTNVSMSADGSDHPIGLERFEGSGIRVQGRVLDDATGQPVPTFKFLINDTQSDLVAYKDGAEGRFSAWLEGRSNLARIKILAEGYQPSESEPFPTTNGEQWLEFRLRHANGWDGLVLLANGKPAIGAEVALVSQRKGAILGRRKLLFKEQCVCCVTDSDGRFHFGASEDAKLIVAVHQQGYAERDLTELVANPIVRLQPWGRVEGVLEASGHAVGDEKVCISRRFWNPWIPAVTLNADPFIVTTDGSGQFAFEDVPPGDYVLGRLFPGGLSESRATAQVKPGETTTLELGGNGRPVSGKVHLSKVEAGFDFSHSRGELKALTAKPVDLENTARRKDFVSDEVYEQAAKSDGARRTAYWQSVQGLVAWRQARSYAVWFSADGTLHAEDVPAGAYDLNVTLQKPSEPGSLPPMPRGLGFYKARIVVPEPTPSEPKAQADLGIVELQQRWQ